LPGARVQSRDQEIFELQCGSRRFDTMRTTTPDSGRPGDAAHQDPDDWTDAGTFQRAEEARVAEAGAEAAALGEDLMAFPTEADEADVVEQHQDLGEDDDEAEPHELSAGPDYE
jgi:hypothetical protein